MRSTLRIVGSAVLKLFVAVSVAKAGQTDQQLLQLVPPGGTETSVRVELNRAVTGSAPDASLIQKRSHLRADDDAWCIVKALPAKDEIRRSLYVFDPSLPGLLHDGDGFEFGIRYGARVEFEYEVTRADNSTDSISDTVVQPLLGKGKASMIVPRQADGGHIHRLKVSKARYEAWLTEVAASRRAPDLKSKWRSTRGK